MRKLCLLSALLFSVLAVFAQATVQYEVSFPNAIHHEGEISLTLSQLPAGKLTVRMSRSSPGRYATHEFGKNVTNVSAEDLSGKPVTITQVQGDVYEIENPGKAVKISYTIYGNWVDGTYLGIDETHAHMNMPATFMWAKGLESREIEVKFTDLDKYGWKVISQLKSTPKAGVYTAPNLQYFMDSPTELSASNIYSWTDKNTDGINQTLRVAVHSPDNATVINNFGKMVEKMSAEAKAIFGEMPKFDYGVYTFIQDVHPDNAGDGMEHRNSTIIVERDQKVEGNENGMMSTFSHEFFHAWNVERIRPKSLEPFNFEQANMSSELWLAEGFTQYYGSLILKRAGFITEEDYIRSVGGTVNAIMNSPGALKYSPAQMSRNAVFTDAGVSVDQNNNSNNFLSYYTYGAGVALALDLRLRAEFGKTLDDYMRQLWITHGKPERAYNIPDLQAALQKITNAAFAEDFFKRYVYNAEKNNYTGLLANAGLTLQKSNPGKASLGRIFLNTVNNKARVTANTLEGTPAYESGLGIGDYLLKVGGMDITGTADLNKAIQDKKPGEEIEIVYEHKGVQKTSKVKLFEDYSLKVVKSENSTGQQDTFRNNWLSSKVK